MTDVRSVRETRFHACSQQTVVSCDVPVELWTVFKVLNATLIFRPQFVVDNACSW